MLAQLAAAHPGPRLVNRPHPPGHLVLKCVSYSELSELFTDLSLRAAELRHRTLQLALVLVTSVNQGSINGQPPDLRQGSLTRADAIFSYSFLPPTRPLQHPRQVHDGPGHEPVRLRERPPPRPLGQLPKIRSPESLPRPDRGLCRRSGYAGTLSVPWVVMEESARPLLATETARVRGGALERLS